MRLRHYLYIVSLVVLSACNSEELNTSDTTDGEIRLSAATIGGNTAVTTRTTTSGELKAFTTGTKIALQVSGTWTKESSSETVVKTPTATAAASITTANSLTLNPALYWDDFGTADPNNKDTGRANGLTIFGVACDGETTAPTVSDWTSLTWDLGDDQSSGISANDLLLSNNVSGANAYKFDSRTEDGKQLEFKHVLSKITVNILAGDGFDGKFTNDPVVVLTSNEANSTTNAEWAYTSGTFDVTTGKLDESSLIRNTVTMAQAGTNGNTVTMEALVMPGSIFASDAATIMRINADGNIYYITAKKIREATGLTLATNDVYTLKAGKNYIFNVKVNKTGVTVTATVKDWDTVDSEEETPAISFTADVTSSTNTTTGSSLSSGDTFTLWKTGDLSALATAEKTTVTYDGNSTYTYNPTLYWQSAKDDSYFRALATMTTTGSGTSATTTIAATESTTVNQGTDVLWGTTAAHTGTYSEGSKEYAESSVINPRTSAVPLIFKHAMSNVVVELATSNDASAVDFSKATITISNLYTNGTINIADGEVKVPDGSTTSTVAVTVSGATIMVPQTIDTNAKLVINLNDNTDPDKSTTYSLTLNTCKDSNGTVITKWAGGNKYTYTITLKKQQISFRALVQDWDKNTGSGDATLDWD